MKKNKVSVVIPSYNEEDSIVRIIRDTKKLKKFFPLEIIVADGGSKDNTAQLAKRENVKVLIFPNKRGQGIDFCEAAKTAKGNYIVQIDADYQFHPNEITMLVEALDKGADLVIGSRLNQKNAPPIRTFGNFVISLIASLVVLKYVRDTLSGFKAIKAPVLKSLKLKEQKFGYHVEMVIKAIRMHYILKEVPITYSNRLMGSSKVNSLRDGFFIIISIFKARFAKI